jgi:hypothetical protein
MIWGSINLLLMFNFFRCHKCKLPFIIYPDKEGDYNLLSRWNPFIPRYCRKCGQDLMKKEVESDEKQK